MSDLLFAGARSALAAVDKALDALEQRYAAARSAVDKANAEQGERAREIDAHKKHLAELTMAQTAEMEARRRELAGRESAVAEREKAADEKFQRAEAQMRAVEHRAADLSNRLHGHAA
jgi:chromosome segregation ATPase